jgi:hypothetical protein
MNPPPSGSVYRIGDPTPASLNAITHAYVSAKITENFGYNASRTFGDRREIRQPPGPLEHWDVYKDLWNNEVGRKIGVYARQNSDTDLGTYPEVGDLIKDAWRRGDLIVVKTDGRIPSDWTYSRDAVYEFNVGSVIWNGPSASYVRTPSCFIAGTPILMADGTEKPIEEIGAGDMVMSFDPHAEEGLGAWVPQEVTRTFVNTTRVLIDLHGLKVTPGHEFLSDKGEWMTIANILRQDRAIVRDQNGKGVAYRARTNQPLTSFGDAVFKTRFIDPRTGAERRAEVRGAIPFEKVYSIMGGIQTRRNANLLEVLHFDGRLSVQAFAENGRLCDKTDKPLGVLDWPMGTTPFDHEGADSFIVTLDGLPFTPDWIKRIPRDGEETQAVMNAGGGARDCLLLSPEEVKTMRFVDGKGTFNDPAPRQTLPPPQLTLATSNLSPQRLAKRAKRLKQAGLRQVQ